jgi:hypothetical protein
MNQELINDLEIVILAIENGDLEDAIGMLREIQEEQGNQLLRFFLN